MDKLKPQEAIKKFRDDKYKKNFNQSFDLVMNLRDLDVKKPENQVDFFATYAQKLSKEKKIGVLAGPELAESAKGVADIVIQVHEFDQYKDKKLAKKLADEYDFFIAQADVMPKVATAFGRVFGPRGKMPNPKLGSVLSAKASVEPVVEKLKNTVRVSSKKSLNIQVKIADEKQSDEDVEANFNALYEAILQNLPKEKSNVNRVMLKLTMSEPVEIDI